MADIKGIELASDIYGLEDETARDNTETNTSAIAAIQNVIPEDASADNKLVTRKSVLASNSGAHNSIYRGKYLGSSVTAAQYAQISAGTFEDLFIGDYWTIDGVNYRIADFDYWLNSGDTECTKHHVLLIPDTTLYNAGMNDSAVTTGGYINSKMRTTNLANARATINSAFGSTHILNHREFFTSEVTDGKASGNQWVDSDVELMSEVMVFGSSVWTSAPGMEVGIDKCQIKLFQECHELITNRASWLLRSIASATDFVMVGSYGNVSHPSADLVRGVRPVFAICGQ